MQTGYLYVSVAHVVFVSLQRQVSVFFTVKTNESFSVPPPLSIKTQCSPSSKQHNIQSIREGVEPCVNSRFLVYYIYLKIQNS